MIQPLNAQDGMAELQITVHSTPNPNAAKFTLDRELPDGSGRSYFDAETARGDQLAERLFEVDGVRALLLVDNFITVTKTDDEEWPGLVQRIESVIREELGTAT
jgi:hypothetical protein